MLLPRDSGAAPLRRRVGGAFAACSAAAPPLLRAAAALALLLSLAAAAPDLYSPDDAVVMLSSQEEFKRAVLTEHGPALVEFFTPSCPHCVALAPEMRKVADNLKGIAAVAAVDCSKAPRLCELNGVRGFPTLKLFEADLKPNPYTGEPMKDPKVYQGERGARAIAAAVTDLLHDKRITKVATAADLDAFAPALSKADAGAAAGAAEAAEEAKPGSSEGAKAPAAGKASALDKLARVLLFTDKPKTTVLYKGLSLAYTGRLVFGQAQKEGGEEAAAKLGVESYPSLLVIKPDGSRAAYDGPLKAPPLREFLDAFAAPEPVPEASGAGKAKLPGGAPDPDEVAARLAAARAVEVRRLSASDLGKVDGDPDMWLLAVYKANKEGACDVQLEAFDAAAREMGAIIKYGAVNVAGAEGKGRDSVDTLGIDLPALDKHPCKLQVVLLPEGKDKEEQDDNKLWKGGLTDVKALQAFILEEVPDRTMSLTSEDQLQGFLGAMPPGQEFMGRVVLFASKDEVPGIYKALAINVSSSGAKFVFGWIPGGGDPDDWRKAKRMQFHVPRLPGLVAAVPHPDQADELRSGNRPDKIKWSIQPYEGPLKFLMMSTWLRKLGIATGLSTEGQPEARKLTKQQRIAAAAAAVPKIDSQAHLEKHCYISGQLCLMVLVDYENKDAGEHVMLAKEGADTHGDLLRVVAVDGVAQHAIRDAFRIDVGQLPAIVMVSKKNLRYAKPPPGERYGVEAIDALIEGTFTQKVALEALEELPRYVDPSEAPEPAEEEFDLSDIMAEDVHIETTEEKMRKAEQELQAEAEARARKEAEEKAKKAKKSSGGKKKKTKKKGGAKKKAQEGSGSGAKDEL